MEKSSWYFKVKMSFNDKRLQGALFGLFGLSKFLCKEQNAQLLNTSFAKK